MEFRDLLNKNHLAVVKAANNQNLVCNKTQVDDQLKEMSSSLAETLLGPTSGYVANFDQFKAKKYLTDGKNTISNNAAKGVFIKGEDALFKNSSPRCPVVLAVDTSGSMRGDKIDEVNRGVQKFLDFIKKDYLCKKRVELAIVSFNDTPLIISDFGPAETKQFIPLQAKGGTNMAPALEKVLNIIDARKREYKNHGRNYFRPMVFFMTDGGPADEKKFLEMKSKVYELTKQKHLVFFAIKIGFEKDGEQDKRHSQLLQNFDCMVPSGRLDLDKIGDFFNWLSKSVNQVSNSASTNRLEIPDPNAWWKQLAS